MWSSFVPRSQPIRTDDKGITRYAAISERGVTNLAADGEVLPTLTVLTPRVVLRGDITVGRERDVLTIGPIGSRNDYLTVTFKPGVQITTGCMTGTLEEFAAEVARKEEGVHKREYQAALAFIATLVGTRFL